MKVNFGREKTGCNSDASEECLWSLADNARVNCTDFDVVHSSFIDHMPLSEIGTGANEFNIMHRE
jgi:hypothetical protein